MSPAPRPLRLAAAALLLAQAIAIAVLVGRGPAMVLPVAMSSGARSVILTGVDVGVAVIVPLVLGAMSLLGAVLGGRAQLVDHGLRWVEASLSSSITVFLIAQLNGIRELGTLVAIYALTSAMSLFGALQEQRTAPHRMLPAIFGAMVGIVPWGLIAWYEIAPTLAFGGGPAPWVRVLTLTMLALFLAAGVIFWRASRRTRADSDAPAGPLWTARIVILLSVVARSALAWQVAVAIVLGLGADGLVDDPPARGVIHGSLPPGAFTAPNHPSISLAAIRR